MNDNMTRPMTLAELIRRMVTEHPEGAMGAAELLDMEQGSIYAMLSTSPIKTSKAKLGVFQWMALLQHTGDLRSLYKVCQQMGHLCIPIPQGNPDQQQMMRHIARITRETSEAVSALADSMAATSDGGEAISREECRRIMNETFEGLQALGSLYADLKERLSRSGR